HLPILQEKLKQVAATNAKDNKSTAKVIEGADAIMESCNIADLSLHVARKTQPPGKKAEQKALDEQKAAVLEALEAKLGAQLGLLEGLLDSKEGGQPAPSSDADTSATSTLAASDGAESSEQSSSSAAADTSASCPAGDELSSDPRELAEAVLAMEDTFANLQIWADLNDAHYVLLHARREALQGRPASALRLLEKSKPGDKPFSKEHIKLRSRLCKRLGWRHWQRYEDSRIKDLFPLDYPLF
ncbi:hypothetical protein WJX84_011096, partial [Apatococcus fuscideae]